MWAFGCGVVASGFARRRALAGGRRRPRARRPSGVRHQPGRQRLVSIATSMPSTSRNGRSHPGRIPGRWGIRIAMGWTVLSLAVATLLGTWGFLAAALGLRPRLGLQRAAAAPQAQRLVGQLGLRALLRRPGLGDRCGGDGGRPPARAAKSLAPGRPLQRRCARHHDAQRFQVDRRATGAWASARCRCASASQNAARAASVIMAVPQVVVVTVPARLGLARLCELDRLCCCCCQVVMMNRFLGEADRSVPSGTAASACRCT